MQEKRALKAAHFDYAVASKDILEVWIHKFPQKVTEYVAALRAGKTDDALTFELINKESFARDARNLFLSFSKVKNPYDRLNNFYSSLFSLELKYGRGGDLRPLIIAACFALWSNEQRLSFIQDVAKIDYSKVRIARNNEEVMNDDDAKRDQGYLDIRMVINYIMNFEEFFPKAEKVDPPSIKT